MTFGAAVYADAPQPAELPPRDFTGAQYIDSAGCVFLREAQGWVAVLTDDRAQVCGFPPSRTVWAGDKPSPLRAPPDAEAARIERDLTMLTATAEGADSAVARPAIGAVPSGEGAPGDGPGGISAEIARGLALRQQIGAITPSDPRVGEGLCALLGLRRAGADPAAIGDDPTGGLCSGRAAKIAGYRMRDAAEDAQAIKGRVQAAASPASVPVANAGTGARGAAARVKPRASDASSVPQRSGRAMAGRPQGGEAVRRSAGNAELVGPAARFVQIGRFDPAVAESAAKDLARLGFPVMRETRLGADGKRFVVVGPYATRAGLIAALDGIRRAGFGGAVAR